MSTSDRLEEAITPGSRSTYESLRTTNRSVTGVTLQPGETKTSVVTDFIKRVNDTIKDKYSNKFHFFRTDLLDSISQARTLTVPITRYVESSGDMYITLGDKGVPVKAGRRANDPTKTVDYSRYYEISFHIPTNTQKEGGGKGKFHIKVTSTNPTFKYYIRLKPCRTSDGFLYLDFIDNFYPSTSEFKPYWHKDIAAYIENICIVVSVLNQSKLPVDMDNSDGVSHQCEVRIENQNLCDITMRVKDAIDKFKPGTKIQDQMNAAFKVRTAGRRTSAEKRALKTAKNSKKDAPAPSAPAPSAPAPSAPAPSAPAPSAPAPSKKEESPNKWNNHLPAIEALATAIRNTNRLGTRSIRTRTNRVSRRAKRTRSRRS